MFAQRTRSGPAADRRVARIRDIDVRVGASPPSDGCAAWSTARKNTCLHRVGHGESVALIAGMHPIRVLLPGVMVMVVGSRAAHADEAASAAATEATRVRAAVGINNPLSWSNSNAFGISAYLGIGEHHAIRGNVASYKYRSSDVGNVISAAAGGDGDEASYGGDTSDVGIAWVYYPRSMWSGLSLELGVLRRALDHRLTDEFASPEFIATRTTTYAGRAMIGWSWLIYDHVFIAVAAGLSIGHESGTETTERHDGDMPVQKTVSRVSAEAEGLLRLGIAFDL